MIVGAVVIVLVVLVVMLYVGAPAPSTGITSSDEGMKMLQYLFGHGR